MVFHSACFSSCLCGIAETAARNGIDFGGVYFNKQCTVVSITLALLLLKCLFSCSVTRGKPSYLGVPLLLPNLLTS